MKKNKKNEDLLLLDKNKMNFKLRTQVLHLKFLAFKY